MKGLLCGFAAVVFALASSAAASLSWTSTTVNTGRISTCFHFAQDSFQSLGYQDIRITPGVEVSGSKAGVYVAVTCLVTEAHATAMVMASGDDAALVSSLQAEMADRVSTASCFETCH